MSAQFFRIFQHLLPRGQAWRITTVKTLRKFFEGLAAGEQLTTEDGEPLITEDGRPLMAEGGFLVEARAAIDLVWADLFPRTTRELAEWERHFGIQAAPTTAARRQALAAEWAATGGQSPGYLQDLLQTAGFDVWVHEWWSSATPSYQDNLRDPRDYTTDPLVGTAQCTSDAFPDDQPQCTAPFDEDGVPFAQHLCNRFLVNDPGYFVNENLTPNAPPPIPSDPSRWPFFVYVCGEVFPDPAVVPADRIAELKRLILKTIPKQDWVVLLVTHDS